MINIKDKVVYIMAALDFAERVAPKPPVIDPAEELAARGAVIVDAMEVDE